MVYTEVKEARTTEGKLRVRTWDVQFDDTTYDTGGYAFRAKDVGLLSCYGAVTISTFLAAGTALTAIHTPVVDVPRGFIQLFTGSAEFTAGNNPSTFRFRIKFYGR